MPRSSLAVFTAIWRSYSEGRLERSLELIDGDCDLMLLDGSAYHGHDGVRRWLADVRRDWKTLTVSYDEVHEVDPECVIGVGRVTGLSADGTRDLDLPLACVAEFRDRRVIRARAFTDRREALRYARERHAPAP
jgi:ketosteroid isomerase-like protein